MKNMYDFNYCVEIFMMTKQAEKRSVKTLKAYYNELNNLKKHLENNDISLNDINNINKIHMLKYFNYLTYEKRKWDNHEFNMKCSEQVGLSEASVNNARRNLNCFFNFLIKERLIKITPMENLKQQHMDKGQIFVLNKHQVEELLKTPNKHTFSGFRDYVIILIMLDNGIRINELFNIKLGDVDFENKTIKINSDISKNNKQRYVPISDLTIKNIKLLSEYCRLQFTDYLILNQYGEKLTNGTLNKNLTKYGKMCGINNTRVSPHTLRHTFATNYLLNGGDVFSLKSILGHSCNDMVERYVHFNEQYINHIHNKCTPLNNFSFNGFSSSEKRNKNLYDNSKKKIMFNLKDVTNL